MQGSILILITCIVLARQRWKIESMNWSEGNFACQGKSVKTLTRKLGRKRSWKKYCIFDHQLVEKRWDDKQEITKDNYLTAVETAAEIAISQTPWRLLS